MMSTIHVLSDGSVKQRFTEHLNEQARSLTDSFRKTLTSFIEADGMTKRQVDL